MNIEGLSRMTKIEVVVSGADAGAVRGLFTASGATGFTSVSGVSGFGHGGFHQGRLLFNDQAALELLITVVADERAEGLLAGVRELLDSTAGVMFASEAWVSRPEYFR